MVCVLAIMAFIAAIVIIGIKRVERLKRSGISEIDKMGSRNTLPVYFKSSDIFFGKILTELNLHQLKMGNSLYSVLDASRKL